MAPHTFSSMNKNAQNKKCKNFKVIVFVAVFQICQNLYTHLKMTEQIS